MKPVTEGFGFRVVATDGAARAGVLVTPHGEVPTPTFMPVGTQGSVKSLSPAEVAATGARIVLGNTYHLWLRPGAEIVAELGGLHRFCRWPHSMLTDSGGFQAFSLGQRCRIHDDGFDFQSHLNGEKRSLTPETAMRVQGLLGADIAMQLDVCPPAGVGSAELEVAVSRTTAWARRCLACKAPGQALFGIVQGGTDVSLRLAHAEQLRMLGLDGLALGGLSVGEPVEVMHSVVAEVAPKLDPERPRYLMGVGTPQDLLRAVAAGIDMFDCVLPTRNARNGQALTPTSRVVIKQARYREDPAVLMPGCTCPACAQGFSRAYLRHLYLANEILVLRLLSEHNLHLYGTLMREARQAIIEGRYAEFARSLRAEDPRSAV